MPKRDAGRSFSISSQESYKAVIIADLIAEVQTDDEKEQRLKNQDQNGSLKKNGHEVNHGFDTKTEGPAAVVTPDSMETVDVGHAKANGTNLSKGVILNAQFVLPDGMKSGESPMELSNSLSVQVVDGHKGADEKTRLSKSDFRHMSGKRKVAFVFSFLPSIMFVLCFSIILPCHNPLCEISEAWSIVLNDTEVVSGIKTPGNIIFSYSCAGEHGVKCLEPEKGEEKWTQIVSSSAHQMECGKFNSDSEATCLVLETSGYLHLYNTSTGQQFRNRSLPGGEYTFLSSLPDCNGDGTEEIAFADSQKRIQILFLGMKIITLNLTECDSAPTKLTPWTINENQTDLVFICQKRNKDVLMKISQDKWCLHAKSKILPLYSREAGQLADSKLLPTPDGLLLWNKKELSLFAQSGDKNWTVSTEEHSDKNRYLLYGKFGEKIGQVALFSSNIASDLQMTTLDVTSGKMKWNKTVDDVGLRDLSIVHGKDKDFVIALKKTLSKDESLKSKAIAHISNVTSDLLGFPAESETKDQLFAVENENATEEITFIELGEGFLPLVEKGGHSLKGSASQTSITVYLEDNKDEEDLVVIELKTFESPLRSQIRSLRVKNWDISLQKCRKCMLKF